MSLFFALETKRNCQSIVFSRFGLVGNERHVSTEDHRLEKNLSLGGPIRTAKREKTFALSTFDKVNRSNLIRWRFYDRNEMRVRFDDSRRKSSLEVVSFFSAVLRRVRSVEDRWLLRSFRVDRRTRLTLNVDHSCLNAQPTHRAKNRTKEFSLSARRTLSVKVCSFSRRCSSRATTIRNRSETLCSRLGETSDQSLFTENEGKKSLHDHIDSDLTSGAPSSRRLFLVGRTEFDCLALSFSSLSLHSEQLVSLYFPLPLLSRSFGETERRRPTDSFASSSLQRAESTSRETSRQKEKENFSSS